MAMAASRFDVALIGGGMTGPTATHPAVLNGIAVWCGTGNDG